MKSVRSQLINLDYSNIPFRLGRVSLIVQIARVSISCLILLVCKLYNISTQYSVFVSLSLEYF